MRDIPLMEPFEYLTGTSSIIECYHYNHRHFVYNSDHHSKNGQIAHYLKSKLAYLTNGPLSYFQILD